MKRNSLILSILTLILCVSLVAGASFALFTSESKVNVAVTSGTVNVTATFGELSYESTLGETLPQSNATVDNNTITINKIVPGDVIKFDITIHNASDVTVKYRTLISIPEDNGLWDGLKVTIGETTITGSEPVTAAWTTLVPGSDDITVPVEITLPVEAGNEYQGKSCKLAYTVEAVQGNATTDEEIFVTTIEQLRAAVGCGKKVVLMADIDVADEELVMYYNPKNNQYEPSVLIVDKNTTIDLNGKKLVYSNDEGICFFMIIVTDATLNILDSSADQSGEVYGADPEGTFAVAVRSGSTAGSSSTANIYGGNFHGKSGVVIEKSSSSTANVNIYGGTYWNDDGNGGLLNLSPSDDEDTTSIMVYGGSFKNFKPGVTNGSESVVASGYKVVQSGDWYNVVPE